MKKNIISCVLFFLLIHFIPSASTAQTMTHPIFNHLTVYVTDMQKSTEFYEKVLNLEKIDEPFKDGRHTWFRIGAHSQLHVVSGAKSRPDQDVNRHLSFSVPSLETFMAHLDKMNMQYGSWNSKNKTPQTRPDGVKQIYLQDPDGYWIEINDDRF